MHVGLKASYLDEDNGMTETDMEACLKAATILQEIIIFRSTGRWSLRWLERGHPSKNFHLKGKSSDWGPQAGFVPLNGRFSKKVGNTTAELKSSKANLKGIKYHGQQAAILSLTEGDLALQAREPVKGRTAISRYEAMKGSLDKLITCRDNRGRVEHFIGKRNANTARFEIHYVNDFGNIEYLLKTPGLRQRIEGKLVPVEVMVNHGRPITGDYDLLTICPKWGNYGERSLRPMDDYDGNRVFGPGINMDKPLDMLLHTGRKDQRIGGLEHPHMGNLTPRVLRCVNLMNKLMGCANGMSEAWCRRVHHNMESLRPSLFGAITGDEMTNDNEGFPFTVFLPKGSAPTFIESGIVLTLHNMDEFKSFIASAGRAGYQFQKNGAWGLNFHGI